MSFPQSWFTANIKNLIDYIPLRKDIPSGKSIYMTELTPDDSTRDARLSTSTQSAALMQFAVNSDAITDSALMPILTKTLMGGYWTGDTVNTNKKSAPFKHPFFPGMYCKDIVGMKTIGVNDPLISEGNIALYGQYGVTVLTLSFETLPYYVGKMNATINPNWISTRVKASNNRIQTPAGWYVFTEGTYIGKTAMLGAFQNQQTSYIVMTVYGCPHNVVYNDDTEYKPYLGQFFGTVNSSSFAGFNINETVLMDNMEIQSAYTDWTGQRLYDVNLIFLYNESGWNKMLDRSGSWSGVKLNITGTPLKPFLTQNFNNILNHLNPL